MFNAKIRSPKAADWQAYTRRERHCKHYLSRIVLAFFKCGGSWKGLGGSNAKSYYNSICQCDSPSVNSFKAKYDFYLPWTMMQSKCEESVHGIFNEIPLGNVPIWTMSFAWAQRGGSNALSPPPYYYKASFISMSITNKATRPTSRCMTDQCVQVTTTSPTPNCGLELVSCGWEIIGYTLWVSQQYYQ